MKRSLTVTCLALLALPFVGGCGPSAPPPADAAVARQTLHTAMDAWKNKESVDSLQSRQPPIYVSEHEWGNRYTLVDYKVDEKDEPFGADLRCKVQLTLKDKKGKEFKKTATYSVGTNKKLTVVREDDE